MPADFLSHNAVDTIKFDLTSFAKEQNKDKNSKEFEPVFTKQSAT
jgi:hypothetical protein